MISVILPSYNSEFTISRVLTALQNQTFSEPYEIILVDSSIDMTPDIVIQEFPDIMFIHLQQKTDPGTARNIGLSKSSGDIILFIDSDCIAQPDWIEKMVCAHRNSNHAAIGGAILNGNDPKSNIAWAGYMAEFREFIPQQKARITDHNPTCNISYKRNYLEDLGGFNPKYYPQEDLEFNYRLGKLGCTIFFYPDICVAHYHRTRLSAFLKHQANVGKITSRMLKILPLSGSKIVKNKIIVFFIIPLLPFVKWFKTVLIFIRLQPKIVFSHPLAVFIFALGLLPWVFGFFQGVFQDDK